MARTLRLWLTLLLLLLVVLQLADVVQAEIPRHSKEIERVLTSRIASLEIVLKWLKEVELDKFRIEMEKLAEELKFKNLSKLASEILFEVYTNASLAMAISGIELRALKKLAGLNDVLTVHDVIQLIDAVRYGLLGDSSKIPSCSSVLSKTLTNIVYRARGYTCKYNSTDITVLLLLWFSTPRSKREQALLQTLLEIAMLVEKDHALPWNLSQYAGDIAMHKSVVLGVVVYELALPNAVTIEKGIANSVPRRITEGDKSYGSKLLELVRILEELQSMNVSISSTSIGLAIKLIQEIEINASIGPDAEIEKLIRVAKALIEVYKYREPLASISFVNESFDKRIISSVLRGIIGRIPAIMREEVGIESSMIMGRRVPASSIGPQAVYEIRNSAKVEISRNLNEISIDPAVIDLLERVNRVDIIEELKRSENISTKEAVTLHSNNIEEWNGCDAITVPIAVAIPILVAYILLKIMTTQRRLEISTASPTALTLSTKRVVDKLFIEYWRTVLGISRKAGIDIQRSDTHREAVSRITEVLDERDLEVLMKVSKIYELARFSYKPISNEDKEQALKELQRLFRKYGRGA